MGVQILVNFHAIMNSSNQVRIGDYKPNAFSNTYMRRSHKWHAQLIISLIIIGSVLFAAHADASVVTYPAPSDGIPLSSDFAVTADGQHVDVYQVKVSRQFSGYTPCPTSYEVAAMAYFDFSGTVNVQITSAVPVSTVTIRPLRHNIQPTINGNTISFSLSHPANLSIEINGDDRHNLHLFANPREQNVPSPSDPNILYFGPGVHGNGSGIGLEAEKTVYIAGGAIIYGYFYNANAANTATIRGRGILSGEKTSKDPCPGNGGVSLISSNTVKNLTLEGFIGVDASSWAYTINNTDSFYMDNVKYIDWRGNDGLDLLSTSQATIKNIFIRSNDDTFAIKSDPYFITPTHRPSENIVIQDSVSWPDGAGHAIAFMEQSTPYIRNVQIKNIDIVHAYAPAVYFICCDLNPGEQYHVTLNDVRVEDMKFNAIFEFDGHGSGNNIRDVYINNFSLLGGNVAPSKISGTHSSAVSNITFNNLNYLGRDILNASDGQFNISGNTSNIAFTHGSSTSPPNPTPTPRGVACQ